MTDPKTPKGAGLAGGGHRSAKKEPVVAFVCTADDMNPHLAEEVEVDDLKTTCPAWQHPLTDLGDHWCLACAGIARLPASEYPDPNEHADRALADWQGGTLPPPTAQLTQKDADMVVEMGRQRDEARRLLKEEKEKSAVLRQSWALEAQQVADRLEAALLRSFDVDAMKEKAEDAVRRLRSLANGIEGKGGANG